MRLEEVLHGIDATHLAGPDPAMVEVSAVASDSRAAGEGVLFVAIAGRARDGHDFARAAVEAGSPAVMLEREVPGLDPATVLQTADARRALALAAANLHDRPAEHLTLVGITGTNGKTTVTWLLDSIARAAGMETGVVGTVGYRVAGELRAASHTTPPPEVLQSLLAEMRRTGVEIGILEVSSHALDQERVAGCTFRAAAFTNLTRDHLDYHQSFEAYFDAKALLFTDYLVDGGVAVVNADDPMGVRLLELISDRPVRCIATSVAGAIPSMRVRPGPADDVERVEVFDAAVTLAGVEAQLSLPGGDTLGVRSPLVGTHNLQNICTAVGLAVGLAVDTNSIASGIAAARGVPGRLERVDDPQGAGDDARHVFVDYAHTDDALTRVIGTLKRLTPKDARLVVVFGCGGDRDAGKRPMMGKAASAADLVVVTSDNPRSEDPQAIIDAILPGIEPGTEHRVEPDRRRAIDLAIGLSRPGDVVLIAGKGHETVQIIGDAVRPFDDRVVAHEALAGVAPGTRDPGQSQH